LARRQGCKGSIAFDVEVDDVGLSRITEVHGLATPALRTCLQAAVGEAALAPATDCRGAFLTSTTEGTLTWDMGDMGISARLANVAGVIPALDPSCSNTTSSGITTR
jgi:hypothetical protein